MLKYVDIFVHVIHIVMYFYVSLHTNPQKCLKIRLCICTHLYYICVLLRSPPWGDDDVRIVTLFKIFVCICTYCYVYVLVRIFAYFYVSLFVHIVTLFLCCCICLYVFVGFLYPPTFGFGVCEQNTPYCVSSSGQGGFP